MINFYRCDDREWLLDFLPFSASAGLSAGFTGVAISFLGDGPSFILKGLMLTFLSSRSLIFACFSFVLMAAVCATISISRALSGCGGDTLRLDFPGTVAEVDAVSEMIFFSNDSFAFAANSDFSAFNRFNSLSWFRSFGRNSSTFSVDFPTLGASLSELSRSLAVGWSFTTGAGFLVTSTTLLFGVKISRYLSGFRRAGE